jgi:hypothetical protein
MRSGLVYLIACLLAATMPLLPLATEERRINGAHGDAAAAFPGWPASFEGRALTPLPLSERERRFGEGFPGRVGRFTDGTREIIIRWVTEPTRKLHPASDCFASTGYAVQPLPLRVDDAGERWGAFTASRGAERLRVRERIHDGAGRSWTDASAWYWSALADDTPGPWWAITVAESETMNAER